MDRVYGDCTFVLRWLSLTGYGTNEAEDKPRNTLQCVKLRDILDRR
jgi:hypothetical protein